jgi:hypothetical protein
MLIETIALAHPLVLPVIFAVTAAASAGVGIASAAGAFAPDTPEIPGRDDPAVEAQRKQALRARAAQTGRQATILTPADEEAPVSTRPTLLGGVSSP